jgi:hypothetical protein
MNIFHLKNQCFYGDGFKIKNYGEIIIGSSYGTGNIEG